MEHFIYSINITLPVFLVIVIGYLLKRIGMLDNNFVDKANKFNFTVTLPALLFKDLSTINFSEQFHPDFVLFCMISTSVCFWLIWGGAKLFLKDKRMRSAFVQGSFRSSAAVLGIAFIQNLCGDSGMGPMMIVSTVPLYNIYSVLVLTLEVDNGGQKIDLAQKMKDACVNIIKNPIILGILAGTLVSLLHIQFPVVINKTVGTLSSMATPLALIAIGAGFEIGDACQKVKPALAATFIKLVAQTAVFLPVILILGFDRAEIVACLIMLSAPTTPSCYIMAKNMGSVDVLTSGIIVLATLFSAVTMTGWIFLLRSMGVI